MKLFKSCENKVVRINLFAITSMQLLASMKSEIVNLKLSEIISMKLP